MPALCDAKSEDTPKSDSDVTATEDASESDGDTTATKDASERDRNVAAIKDVTKAFILANRLGNADMLKSLCISSARHVRSERDSMCFDLEQFDHLFASGIGHTAYRMTHIILATQRRQAVVQVNQIASSADSYPCSSLLTLVKSEDNQWKIAFEVYG